MGRRLLRRFRRGLSDVAIPFHPAFRHFYPEPGETATETQCGQPLSRYTSVKTPPTRVQGREAFSCVGLNGKIFPVQGGCPVSPP